uniref:Uncharacterized protein n=1 Tax=Anguilla anguilla TaxID=7936 RepID=A0A0E9PC16_ANGAN
MCAMFNNLYGRAVALAFGNNSIEWFLTVCQGGDFQQCFPTVFPSLGHILLVAGLSPSSFMSCFQTFMSTTTLLCTVTTTWQQNILG